MQQDAIWQLDSDDSRMEKAYCCVASNARDFARFGMLFKNKGVFAGEQILSEEFTEMVSFGDSFDNDDLVPVLKDYWKSRGSTWIVYANRKFLSA